MPGSRKITRRKFLALSALGVAGYAGYGWLGSKRVHTVEHTLELPRWDHQGYRLALLSDLHVVSPLSADLARVAVQRAVDERPDAIVMPGDFSHLIQTGDDFSHLQRALEPLREFEGPILGSFGNHDYNVQNQSRLVRTLDKAGVQLLKNDVARVRGVTFRGYDDALHGRPQESQGALREQENTITLFHEPDLSERLEGKSSLIVSGHSHGGQICLPLGIAMYTPFGARKYIAGFYPEARSPLYVTRGVGVMRSIRYNCPPEIVVLTLNSMEKGT